MCSDIQVVLTQGLSMMSEIFQSMSKKFLHSESNIIKNLSLYPCIVKLVEVLIYLISLFNNRSFCNFSFFPSFVPFCFFSLHFGHYFFVSF